MRFAFINIGTNESPIRVRVDQIAAYQAAVTDSVRLTLTSGAFIMGSCPLVEVARQMQEAVGWLGDGA